MVQQVLFFFFFLGVSTSLFAQDERYYRKLLSGDLPRAAEDIVELQAAKFNVSGASYHLDLDGNGIEEIIEPQKRDGVDWIEIKSFSQSKIFEAKLLAMGSDSHIYKIKFVKISDKVKALIVHLDEGKTKGKRFESTARIYVLTFENNDLSNIAMTEGPHFYHEKQAQREQYWRRDYAVNVYDIDGDGVREIAIQYNHIQRILKYDKRGEWTRL